jgi:hypothetical protein
VLPPPSGFRNQVPRPRDVRDAMGEGTKRVRDPIQLINFRFRKGYMSLGFIEIDHRLSTSSITTHAPPPPSRVVG